MHTLKSKCENTSLNKVGVSDLNTFQGEKVKSVEELTISNFLYLNGIEYEYEKAYPFGDIPYQPDFYLKEYDIYLEHFGIDENENAKWLDEIEEKKYVHGIKLKREKHEKFGTKLLETYSYYNRNNVLLEKLTEILNNENVVFKPREMDVIFEKVTNNNPNYGKEIINLIKTFVNLYKSRKMDVKSVKSLFLNKKNFDSFYIKRHDCFLKFVIPILNKYDQALQERNEIDFHDMINLATDLIKEKLPDYSYKYIIIDEYQDVSFSRFNLIKEIRDLSKSRLICVGDDWQSIYRFAGSDISLFSNFEKFIGKHEQLFIEQTYRNSQPLIEVTSKFIQKNPKQIVKSPKSKKEPLKNPIQFVNYYQGNAEAPLVNQIELLVKKYGKKSIIVLGRHNFDINEFITRSPESRIMYYERTGKLHVKGFEDVDISYLSIHKSKGLEADNVIVLNLRNHLLGFPNKIADDPILSLLLSDSESYPFSEERRLFYVALTRTKNEVILLIPKDASIFVDELLKDRIKSNNIDMDNEVKCPCCKTGNLVLRTKYFNKKFLGCSNYPLCKQTFQNIEIIKRSKKCSKCKSGFMVMRQGKYGNFLGCTNYPHCNNVIKLK